MDGQRLYIAFRRIYDSVPKSYKQRFINYNVRLIREILQEKPEWAYHQSPQNLLSHLGIVVRDEAWWFTLRAMTDAAIFQEFFKRLRPTYCVHYVADPSIVFCPSCLPVR